MKRCEVLGLAIATALALGMPSLPLLAQGGYPDRPIRLVVPFPPGGNTDIMGRRFANKVTPLLGQNIIIDNRGGAGGSIGAAEVARAKPDGYTLLVGTSSPNAITPIAMAKPPYDPVKDFAMIAELGLTPQAIAVHPIVAGSLEELIKRVKAMPGKYSYGSAGMGSINHLTGELFKSLAGGLDIVHVPYRGSGNSAQDLIAGHIPILVSTISAIFPHHVSGKARLLAVFSEKRSATAPDIPTAIELGVPRMVAYAFVVLCAPAGTPRPIIDRIHQATTKVMQDEAFQKDLTNLAIEPVTDSNPEKATQFIKDEIAKWAPIIKATGAKAL